MAFYTTIHLHNVPAGRDADYAAWFDGAHRAALAQLRGFSSAERYEVTPQQMMPDIPQPWRFLSVYDFDLPDPAIDIPALGPLVADARDAGMIADDETERLYNYRLFADWKASDAASCSPSVRRKSASISCWRFSAFSFALYSSTTAFGASGYSWYSVFRNTPPSA